MPYEGTSSIRNTNIEVSQISQKYNFVGRSLGFALSSFLLLIRLECSLLSVYTLSYTLIKATCLGGRHVMKKVKIDDDIHIRIFMFWITLEPTNILSVKFASSLENEVHGSEIVWNASRYKQSLQIKKGRYMLYAVKFVAVNNCNMSITISYIYLAVFFIVNLEPVTALV